MNVRQTIFCAWLILFCISTLNCGDDKNNSNKSDISYIRTLVDPEYSYTDDFEDKRDEEFWYKSANNNFQAIDVTDKSNYVVESMYGSPEALQSGGDHWSELSGKLPLKAVQIEFGFREFTLAS